MCELDQLKQDARTLLEQVNLPVSNVLRLHTKSNDVDCFGDVIDGRKFKARINDIRHSFRSLKGIDLKSVRSPD